MAFAWPLPGTRWKPALSSTHDTMSFSASSLVPTTTPAAFMSAAVPEPGMSMVFTRSPSQSVMSASTPVPVWRVVLPSRGVPPGAEALTPAPAVPWGTGNAASSTPGRDEHAAASGTRWECASGGT
ncbi:hypothetical protein ACFQ0O_14305 [Saccharopolyspora spinosporotrichia]